MGKSDMEEYRDDKKSKLYYMDEILHKISSMSQAENEKQLDDITPSILKSVGKYTAADRAYSGSRYHCNKGDACECRNDTEIPGICQADL